MMPRSSRWGWVWFAALTLSGTVSGMYCPEAGRFLQQDPVGYVDGLNLYEYASCSPIKNIDAMGLWGSDIHYQETSNWAEMVGYPQGAAFWVGSADNSVDALFGGIGPYPWADLSYHFNRNSPGQEDSRIVHYAENIQIAKDKCIPSIDDPYKSADHLGTAIHPYQDWVAHGDYFVGIQITDIHNSHSRQRDFGNPSNYPDNPALDAIGSPDGRPAGNAILWITETITPNPGQGGVFPPKPITVSYDYAMYGPGIHRYLLTEQMTKRSLYEFREWIRMYGGCICKKFFGITSQ
jgi:hypothetical protein